ncbi:MAG: hypothetical protein IJD75_07565 [Clostridia bacterium]|nr:hypothetical protein [Clostridia bacterium]
MTKRKLIAIIIIGVVVFTATVGGAVAYMIKTFQGQQSDFKPAQISCTFDGAFVNDQKSELIVTNTSNIDAYIRVRMVTYWVDANGNVINRAAAPINFTIGDNWVKAADSDTYYYRLPVAAGAQTSDLLNSTITQVSEDGYKQVIDVFAEAIQANPVEAVQNSWNVTVSDGKIAP